MDFLADKSLLVVPVETLGTFQMKPENLRVNLPYIIKNAVVSNCLVFDCLLHQTVDIVGLKRITLSPRLTCLLTFLRLGAYRKCPF